jgi:nucleoside 2-deoxyribosyltransferase
LKIYLAGPLFTQAEQEFNSTLAHDLVKAGHRVYLPQDKQDQETQKFVGQLRTEGIFKNNHSELRSSDAMIAVCDGPQVDDGTAWEIGCAYALRIPIYGLRTDRRITQQSDEKINLMILESLTKFFESRPVLLEYFATKTEESNS